MRRSFGGNQGMGGGGGSGGMLKTVARAVTRAGVTGVQEPFSASTTTAGTTSTRSTAHHKNKPNSSNLHSISSSGSPYSPLNLPISSTSALPTWPSFSSSSSYDEFEWVSVDGSEDERAHSFFDDFVLGSVPSKDEVQYAVSAIHQVFDPATYSQLNRDGSPTNKLHRVSSVGSESDWMEPSLQLSSSRMLQPYGSGRVYDAFHLLQTEPSVQRMVTSLSSDKAVWDAVMNNVVVRELKEAFYAAESKSATSSDESSDGSNKASNILKWIFDGTKAKAMELIEKITKIANQLFQPPEKTTGNAPHLLEERLRSSFLLTIVVMLIVVVTRCHN